MPKVSHNVNAIKLSEHTRRQRCTSSSKKRKLLLKHNMFYGRAAFMITESAISSEICMSASSAVQPLPKNSWMPAAKWPIKGSFFLRCVNSYFSFQQSSFSVSARQTSTSLLLASVCRNYDNIWPNVHWAKPQGNALDLAVHLCPNQSHGQELWLVAEMTRPKTQAATQAAKIRLAWLSLGDGG